MYDDAKVSCSTGLEHEFAKGKYAGWQASDVVDGVAENYEEKIGSLLKFNASLAQQQGDAVAGARTSEVVDKVKNLMKARYRRYLNNVNRVTDEGATDEDRSLHNAVIQDSGL